MLRLAHRGAHARYPENTLAAFQSALTLGFDGIETDVRVTTDGHCVLVHDRVLSGARPVAALSHAALEAALGHPVPTLGEALETFPDAYWNIEIKTPDAARLALPLLAAYRHRERLLVTSFRHEVALAAARDFGLESGLLHAHRPLDIRAALAGIQTGLPLRTLVWDAEVADPEVWRAAQELGFCHAVYGARTAEEHARFQDWGAAILISDFPEQVGLPAA
jgi:glycerophosphoryl diester phosphodiesterase